MMIRTQWGDIYTTDGFEALRCVKPEAQNQWYIMMAKVVAGKPTTVPICARDSEEECDDMMGEIFNAFMLGIKGFDATAYEEDEVE